MDALMELKVGDTVKFNNKGAPLKVEEIDKDKGKAYCVRNIRNEVHGDWFDIEKLNVVVLSDGKKL